MSKFSKAMPAFKNTECDNCANEIEEEDNVYFLDGDKYCEACKHEKIENLYKENHTTPFKTKYAGLCNYCEDAIALGDEIVLVAGMAICESHIQELENI